MHQPQWTSPEQSIAQCPQSWHWKHCGGRGTIDANTAGDATDGKVVVNSSVHSICAPINRFTGFPGVIRGQLATGPQQAIT